MGADKHTGDLRGHVVLRMCGKAANPLITQMAARLARAFHGELRGLFVEDEDLLALAALPFAAEISLSGGRARALSVDMIEREMRHAGTLMQRLFSELEQTAKISARLETIRCSAREALGRVGGQMGILVLGEPLRASGEQILSPITDLAGVLMMGPNVKSSTGPIAVLLEPGAQVAHLVDTAERIAADSDNQLLIVIAAAGTAEAGDLEQASLGALDVGTRYKLEHIAAADAIPSRIRQHHAGLLVTRLGSSLTRDLPQAARIARLLECPLLSLR